MRESRKLYFRGGYLQRKMHNEAPVFGVQMSVFESAQSILAKFVARFFFVSQSGYRN